MSDKKFNPERARKTTIESIDITAMTVIANRAVLAETMLERNPEHAHPSFGPAVINMTLSVLAALRDRIATDDNLLDARDMPDAGEIH